MKATDLDWRTTNRPGLVQEDTVDVVLPLIIDLPEGAYLGLMLPLVIFEILLGFYLAIFGMREETA